MPIMKTEFARSFIVALLILLTPALVWAQASEISTALAALEHMDDCSKKTSFSCRAGATSLPGHGRAGLHPWLLFTPGTAFDPDSENPIDTNSGEAFYQLIGDQIAATESSLDICSLGIDGKVVEEVWAPRVKELHDRFAGKACKPWIRLISSTTGDDWGEWIVREMGRFLPDDRTKWNVHISGARLGNSIVHKWLWNHCKMVVRDRAVLITGGHDYNIGAYRVAKPWWDLSILVQGDGAAKAAIWYDHLWEEALNHVVISADHHSWGGKKNDRPADQAAPPELTTAGSPIAGTVWSLARGDRDFAFDRSDWSADDAILVALGKAKESIRIAQHHMLRDEKFKTYCREIATALYEAAMRGVSIEILSGELDPRQRYRDHGVKRMSAAGLSGEEMAEVEARFTFRIKPPEFGAWHQKFFMIDDQAFYVGSQNLYPSGFRTRANDPINPLARNLYEYGLLIDDRALAGEVKTGYWDFIWGHAVAYDEEMQSLEGVLGDD